MSRPTRDEVAQLMPGLKEDLGASRRHPVDLGARLSGRDASRPPRGVRGGRPPVPRRGRDDPRSARAARHRAGAARGDRRARRRANGSPVQPLRRRSRRRRGQVGVAAVRGDRTRRRDLRQGLGRHEVEHPHARRRDPRLGREASGRDQGRDRGSGGGRRRRVRDLPGDPPGAVRRGRDGDRRHGERPARRPDAHDRAARDDGGDRRGEDARRPEAQRSVRRRRARRAARAHPRARDHARRERRRRGRGPQARAVDRRVVHGRGVQDALGSAAGRAVPGDGRARRADLVGAGAHRDRDRRVAGRQRRERGRALRASQGERPHPSRAGPARGASGARAPLREPAAVRRLARRPHRGDRERVCRRHGRARVRRRP